MVAQLLSFFSRFIIIFNSRKAQLQFFFFWVKKKKKIEKTVGGEENFWLDTRWAVQSQRNQGEIRGSTYIYRISF